MTAGPHPGSGAGPVRIPAVAALLAIEARVTRLAGNLTRLGAAGMTAAPAAEAMFEDPLLGLDVVLPRRVGEPDGEQPTGEIMGETSEGVPDAVGAGDWANPRRPGPDWGWSGLERRPGATPAGASGGLDAAVPPSWADRPVADGQPVFGARPGGASVRAGVPADADRAAPGAPVVDGRVAEPDAGLRRRNDPALSVPPGPANPVAAQGFSEYAATAGVPAADAGQVNGATTPRDGALRVSTDPHAALSILRANLTDNPSQPGATREDAGPAPDAAPPPHPTTPARPAAPYADRPNRPSTTAGHAPEDPEGWATGAQPTPEPSEELVETLLDAMTDRLRLDVLRSYGTTED